ncbi:MAG: molybdenum cofactor guanylyltransferase MobA [Burkholderiaceae bacterium]
MRPLVTPTPPITALILAGGRGARMGGADKGMQTFQGRPLVQHALERLRAQSLPPAQILISANRHRADYESLGVPVLADALPDHPGPLAGFLAGLTHAGTPLLLTVPCDTPHFPLSLCERLAHNLQAQEADLAMIATPERDARGTPYLQAQPVFCLLRTMLAGSLQAYLQAGGRRILDWSAQHRSAQVAFNRAGDDPQAFANLNTLDALRAAGAGPGAYTADASRASSSSS